MVAQLRYRGLAYSFRPVTATGGTVSTVTIEGIPYRVHTFPRTGSVQNFVITDPGSEGEIDYLVIAGGGGGSGGDNEPRQGGGGGGAGGLLTTFNSTPFKISDTTYPIFVGAGGSGSNRKAQNGQNTTAFGLTAIGGGAGGNAAEDNSFAGNSGNSGGSGGGAARSGAAGVGTPGQGHNGSLASPSSGSLVRGQGGGGGGAGGPGVVTGSQTTAPGPGRTLNVIGTNISYAVGGTGGTNSATGPQGIDGRGNGGGGALSAGGGKTDPTFSGTRGGHGIVIIRYPLAVVPNL
jgi:hypothetical protein